MKSLLDGSYSTYAILCVVCLAGVAQAVPFRSISKRSTENDMGTPLDSTSKLDSVRNVADEFYSGMGSRANEFAHLGFGAPTSGDAYSPYYGYEQALSPYQALLKSSQSKREDPDNKGQFRLRFGRSGVRLRFGRSDPPTLRFG